MDKYLVELDKIASSIEEACGLNLVGDQGIPIHNLQIDDVVQFCDNNSRLPKQALKDLNVTISRQIVKLAYANARMNYFKKKKLDFSMIPCLSVVADALMCFTVKSVISNEQLIYVDKVIVILTEVVAKDKTAKNMLSYRFIRIFILLIIYGCNCSAGILADFLLHQMIVDGHTG